MTTYTLLRILPLLYVIACSSGTRSPPTACVVGHAEPDNGNSVQMPILGLPCRCAHGHMVSAREAEGSAYRCPADASVVTCEVPAAAAHDAFAVPHTDPLADPMPIDAHAQVRTYEGCLIVCPKKGTRFDTDRDLDDCVTDPNSPCQRIPRWHVEGAPADTWVDDTNVTWP